MLLVEGVGLVLLVEGEEVVLLVVGEEVEVHQGREEGEVVEQHRRGRGEGVEVPLGGREGEGDPLLELAEG